MMPALPPFQEPGPGAWHIIDHIVHPGSRCFSDYYYRAMQNGWNEEARRIGVINRVKIREVNGFMYYQMSFVNRSVASQMIKIIEGYWQEKRFLKDLALWDKVVKPRSIHKLLSLQEKPLERLSDDELLKHVEKCFIATKQMVKNHHKFTYTSFIPIGDFVRQVSGWTRMQPTDILGLIKGERDQLSIAIQYIPIKRLVQDLRKNARASYLLSQAEQYPNQANSIIEQLFCEKGSIAEGLHFFLKMFGYRVVDGYDITSETYIERPDLLLKSLKAMTLSEAASEPDNAMEKVHALIPSEKHKEFAEIRSDAQTIKRLRDERGIYTDLWAIGILRHAFLEAGSRLYRRNLIASPELVLDASCFELAGLFGDSTSTSSDELIQRAQYRQLYNVEDAPLVIGEHDDKPIANFLSHPDLERAMSALITSINLAVEHPGSPKSLSLNSPKITGIGASRGIVDGFARVVESSSQLEHVQKGDILVVYQSTAAFNAVFPIIGGIISQFGGTLSHPAILAREQGIPCIVGCNGAIKDLKTGMYIRLDGNAGIVHILPEKDSIAARLEALQCKYIGPMQGRNRDKALNHIPEVAKRQKLIDLVRSDQKIMDVLEAYFQDRISVEEAIASFVSLVSSYKTYSGFSKDDLRGWTHRLNIEFHPADTCNLRCSGCTYFQDENDRPNQISLPYDKIGALGSVFQPRAVTLVGGGEPACYFSQGNRLGDLIADLGNGAFGFKPDLGLISNGTIWPPGNTNWHHYVKWIRFSLDAATPTTYINIKGKDLFWSVVENVFRTIKETNIPQVGIGFIYHPGNILEADKVITLFEDLIQKRCPDQIDRFNIQFRPWRPPIGKPSIKDYILSPSDADSSAQALFQEIQRNPGLEGFIKNNTNIAVNLLCRGSREKADIFSECLFGLAKNVVRADGSVFPCFRVAAERDSAFCLGNLIFDPPEKIALRGLYINAVISKQVCTAEPNTCLFCVYNNILEKNLSQEPSLSQEVLEDFFF